MSNNFLVRQIFKTGSNFFVGASIAIATLCPIVLTSSRVLADYYGSVRSDAYNQLATLTNKGITPKTIAFTPKGEWVIIYGSYGFIPSANFPQDALNALDTLNKRKSTINTIAFTPKGEWVILNDRNGITPSANFPQDALNALATLNKRNLTLKSVAFDPNGGWAILYDSNGSIYTQNISPAAAATIVNNYNGNTFINIAFTPSNGWGVLLYSTPNVLASPIVPQFNPSIPIGGGGAIRCANTTSICN